MVRCPPRIGKAGFLHVVEPEWALPDLAAEGKDITDRFFNQLVNDGLLSGQLGGNMTANGAWGAITTPLAERFLAFLSDQTESL
ncbi:hypothetical protein SAMN05216270_101118 [Glycomyces harbinensis]|uniref:Uncharacterized protein n=1 Tax=Glycomyces harbinensis TaxID=58114 RepID=A0A1G6QU70_9ACTN|nr:hypothetical protein SAMN05216270_101118 [Glycomyces harbinensis]